MDEHKWVQEFSGAITVCDPEGVILEMNDQAAHLPNPLVYQWRIQWFFGDDFNTSWFNAARCS